MTFKSSIRQDLRSMNDHQLGQLHSTGRTHDPGIGNLMQDDEMALMVDEMAQKELATRERQRVSQAYFEQDTQDELQESFGIDSGLNSSINTQPPADLSFNEGVGEPSEPTVSSSPEPSSDATEESELSDEERAALLIHFVSTTVAPLSVCSPDDYQASCTDCGISPIVDGPHHEEDCKFFHPFILLSSENAHSSDCRHCEARPAVAGYHHEKDCKRGFPALATWSVDNGTHEVQCDSCGVTPDSEGPHHSEDCDAHAPVPLYHTSLAHTGYCAECGALPFVAGPHHLHECDRFVNGIPIPIALLESSETEN